jgi:hypothetical protein
MTADQLFIVAIVVALAGTLGTIVAQFMTQLFTWNTSQEQRRRDLEDRREVVKQAKAATEAAALASKVATQALTIVHAEVVKVGEKADAAYKEANQSNLKIQGVQDVLTTALNLPQTPITATTGANEAKTVPRPVVKKAAE